MSKGTLSSDWFFFNASVIMPENQCKIISLYLSSIAGRKSSPTVYRLVNVDNLWAAL